jgi:hypothetical protein
MIDKQTRNSIVARDAALRAWMGERNSYHPSELPAELLPTVTNDERAQCEYFDWINNPPARYFAYPSGMTIVNWTGIKLADVLWWGRAYRSNMGDTRRSFRCQRAENGIVYSGVEYGTYVRMRAIKG